MGARIEPPRRISGKSSALDSTLTEKSPACRHAGLFFLLPPLYPSTMAYNPRDRYFKRAKQEGYRSRAAYKLIELQQRFRLLKPGDLVVDLGAAPGGWLQVAAKSVGPKGRVIGVDLQRIEAFHEPSIEIFQGDIACNEVQDKIGTRLGAPADCVLCDLSPKLSGIRDTDMARCLELNRVALRVGIRILRPGGTLLIKSFIGDDLHVFTAEVKNFFRSVERTRPEATRQGSSEFYFCARDFRGREKPGHDLRS
jgi:23S rRNA (uridine2552-2'-O)-methyltransferase